MTDFIELKHLLTDSLTEVEIKQYPTIGDVKERISQIIGRPVWTHELAYPAFLFEEYLSGQRMSSFYKATGQLSKRMPIILLEEVKDG